MTRLILSQSRLTNFHVVNQHRMQLAFSSKDLIQQRTWPFGVVIEVLKSNITTAICLT